jgi:hypothetical protein
LGYPNTISLRELYWETTGVALRDQKKPKKMETRTLIIPDFVSMLKTDAAGFPLPCA